MKHQIDHKEMIDGLIYTVVTEKYFEPVQNLFWDFFMKDEPIHKSFGGYPERIKQIEDLVTGFLNDGVSLMVIDPSKNNKVVGIRISYTLTKDEIPAKVKNIKFYSLQRKTVNIFI